MKTEFDCSVIASVLDAGRVLANAGNAGVVVAGVGVSSCNRLARV
jgi:hypothetical protein